MVILLRLAHLFIEEYWLRPRMRGYVVSTAIRAYIYKKLDLLDDALYHKKQLMSFISNMGYFRVDTPADEADQKCLQRLIDV